MCVRVWRRSMWWCWVVLLLVWGLIGCATSGKPSRPGSIPGALKYRPATPRDAPDTAAVRTHDAHADLGAHTLNPGGSEGQATRPAGGAVRPRVLLAASDGPSAHGENTGKSAQGYNVPGRDLNSQMPWKFFLGHAAHRLIAYMYGVKHPGNRVFYNTKSLVDILRQARIGDASRLLPHERNLRPDITDVSMWYIFEIKPWNEKGLQEGRQEVRTYLVALTRAVAPETSFAGGRDFRGELLIRFAQGQYIWRLEWQTSEPGVVQYRWTRSQQRFESEAAAYEAGQWVELSVEEMEQYGGWVGLAVEEMVSRRERLATFRGAIGIVIDIIGNSAVVVFSSGIGGQRGSGSQPPPQQPPAQGRGQVIPFPVRPPPASLPADLPAAVGR